MNFDKTIRRLQTLTSPQYNRKRLGNLQADLKIIDFGLSRFEDGSEAMTTRVGTPYYIAPEGKVMSSTR